MSEQSKRETPRTDAVFIIANIYCSDPSRSITTKLLNVFNMSDKVAICTIYYKINQCTAFYFYWLHLESAQAPNKKVMYPDGWMQ
jgi:hypothetical protein